MGRNEYVEGKCCLRPGLFSADQAKFGDGGGWMIVYQKAKQVRTAVVVAAKKHVPRDGEARLVWARFSWDHNEPGQCFRVAAYPDGTESVDEVRL